jgi:hypothetical protein
VGDRNRVYLNRPDRLGREAIRGLQRSGDRLRLGMTFHMIAGTLAATQPEAAAIILGAAQAHVTIESARNAQLITSAVTKALSWKPSLKMSRPPKHMR